jgi:hypothetical protein
MTAARGVLAKEKMNMEIHPEASAAGAVLALMARKAINLDCPAGIGPDGHLYIASPGARALTWPIPRGDEHLFETLPRYTAL